MLFLSGLNVFFGSVMSTLCVNYESFNELCLVALVSITSYQLTPYNRI